MLLRHLSIALGLGLGIATAAAEPLSASAARAALDGGAIAWDVRAGAAPVIAGAASADASAVQQWLHGGDLAVLARALSAAGIDLSRGVVLYGDPGDRRAQALHQSLQNVTSGGVHWLVGGIGEWRMAGLPTADAPTARRPVPQHLVQQRDPLDAPMAAAALRRSRDVAGPVEAAALR